MQEMIFALAEKYADEISGEISNLAAVLENDRAYDIVENIESGLSGKLLFLIELYHNSPKDNLLKSIEAGATLLTYALKNQPSWNWSLFTGRAGSMYTLLHIYFINRDEGIIRDILDMVKGADQEFLKSEYVSDFLYNGRAGTLLLLFNLYGTTKQEFLLSVINKYVSTIIGNARYTDEGLFWKEYDEVSLRPSCGMAFGVSGIKYVFAVINICCQNKGLDFILQGISSYQQSCWVEEILNWGNFEPGIRTREEFEYYMEAYGAGSTGIFEPGDDLFYQSGMAGIFLGDLVAGNASTNKEKSLHTAIGQKFQGPSLSTNNTDLLNGLSGIGMLLWMDAQGQRSPLLEEIITCVFDKAAINFNNGNPDMRLLKGDLGAVYFLMKTFGFADSKENVLLPFFDARYSEGLFSDVLAVDYIETRQKLLAKTYYRSLGILEMTDTSVFRNYCEADFEQHKNGDITRFTQYLEGVIQTMPSNSNTLLLKDAYSLEKKKSDYFSGERRTGLQLYLDKVTMRNNSLDFLNQPDELILACEIGKSNSFTIIKTKWNWSFYKDMQYEKASLDSGQLFEYLFYYSAEREKVEIPLNLAGMVMHQFDCPKGIGRAIEELKLMLQILPTSILIEYAAVVGSSTIKDFLSRIDYLLLTFIKQMIYEGFLETKSVTYEIVI